MNEDHSLLSNWGRETSSWMSHQTVSWSHEWSFEMFWGRSFQSRIVRLKTRNDTCRITNVARYSDGSDPASRSREDDEVRPPGIAIRPLTAWQINEWLVFRRDRETFQFKVSRYYRDTAVPLVIRFYKSGRSALNRLKWMQLVVLLIGNKLNCFVSIFTGFTGSRLSCDNNDIMWKKLLNYISYFYYPLLVLKIMPST